VKRTKQLPQDPDAWRDPDVLDYLYRDLGWSVDDVVDHFESLGSSEVSAGRVRRVLEDNDIRCGRNNRPPTAEPHSTLWNADKDLVGGGD
jgi:hypothetical protein